MFDPQDKSVKSESSSYDDPVRSLLKQVWRQHNSIVQGFKAELYAVTKKQNTTSCVKCKEFKVILSDNERLRKLVEEKDKHIEYLEKRIDILQNEGKSKNKVNLGASGVALKSNKLVNVAERVGDYQPLVPETQHDERATADVISTQNPVVAETLDPFESKPNEYAPETMDDALDAHKLNETMNPIVCETMEFVHDKSVKSGKFRLEKQEEFDNDATFFAESSECNVESGSGDETIVQLRPDSHNQKNVFPKNLRIVDVHTEKRALESSESYIESVKKCGEDSPSLLDHPIRKHRITEVLNGVPSADAAGDNLLQSCEESIGKPVDSSQECSGFFSSIKNTKNLGAEMSKSPIKYRKRTNANYSFSPSKRKSRKLDLKQTTLDNKFFSARESSNAQNVKTENVVKREDESGSDVLLEEMGLDLGPLVSGDETDDVTFMEDEPVAKKDDYKCLYKKDEPNFKYQEVVRKKDERQRLDGHDCHGCEAYYKSLGLSDEELKKRLKNCSRHRSKHSPPKSPEHFWEVDFPSTQECRNRGYINKTQKLKLKTRRRRPLDAAEPN